MSVAWQEEAQYWWAHQLGGLRFHITYYHGKNPPILITPDAFSPSNTAFFISTDGWISTQ